MLNAPRKRTLLGEALLSRSRVTSRHVVEVLLASTLCLIPGCSGEGTTPDDPDATGGASPVGEACPSGWRECASGCRELSSDGANCGACAATCDPGQVCANGTCATSCPVGTTQCGQSCVDLNGNAQHCGVCFGECGAGQMCSGAACTPLGGGGDAPGSGGQLGGSGGLVGTDGTGGAPATGGAPPAGGAPTTGGDAATGGVSGGQLPFLIGADITHTMEDEYWGATYTDAGAQKPLEVLLKDHGFNAVRIDTFVDPSAPGGFAETQPVAFRSLAQTITLAQRVKAQDMFFLLDLHMSDTWTNPTAQAKPNAWMDLSPSALEDAVYDYVLDAVTQLDGAGARPDMVQIGNEITNGMLWDSGNISNSDFSGFADLLKAGIRAVRDFDPSILVMLHIEKCNNLSTTRWWLDGVLGQGVEFDVLGQSCYAPTDDHSGYQGTPAEWGPVFNTIAAEYPDLKFVIAEYSAEQRAANDVVFNITDQRGLGTFNWDPTRTYDTHPNEPLFLPESTWSDFHVVPELMNLYDQMAADYAAAGR